MTEGVAAGVLERDAEEVMKDDVVGVTDEEGVEEAATEFDVDKEPSMDDDTEVEAVREGVGAVMLGEGVELSVLEEVGDNVLEALEVGEADGVGLGEVVLLGVLLEDGDEVEVPLAVAVLLGVNVALGVEVGEDDGERVGLEDGDGVNDGLQVADGLAPKVREAVGEEVLVGLTELDVLRVLLVDGEELVETVPELVPLKLGVLERVGVGVMVALEVSDGLAPKDREEEGELEDVGVVVVLGDNEGRDLCKMIIKHRYRSILHNNLKHLIIACG